MLLNIYNIVCEKQKLIVGAEVFTSLPLQMAVYFNVLYAPLWVTGSVLALHTKVCVCIIMACSLTHCILIYPRSQQSTHTLENK